MLHFSTKCNWLKYEKRECKIKREGREVKIHLSRRRGRWWNFVKTVLKFQIYRKQKKCWVAERLFAYRGGLFSNELITYLFKVHIAAG